MTRQDKQSDFYKLVIEGEGEGEGEAQVEEEIGRASCRERV